ncbi:telomere repeats-binding bouquet formation protein 1 [Amphiprion ocellaris]|uniref:telomere repeats-binding bouquet formation protein 1 n=1 Tax=Amphiprion ocellaris TaxID=80972 RepID=UPI0024117BF1|nr:telomere repeats-binding bouquet formation protein 1 [Amphiprion ocellaris]
MDKMEVCDNNRNTIKTDLSLLLECLKFQMKCPELQKQALLTIHSICEKREDNVDLLRQLGGVVFVHNLSKSSVVHSEVKETALFTLGTLAEANVYCKNSLCRKETFLDLAGCLMKEDIPLTQKRVSVYLLFVLVADNKLGQTLAQTTGCLDILLDLFRTTYPLSTGAILKLAGATQTYQLWTSVSSALCGCVNNPQNEEGQRICVAAFPIIKVWLQQISLPRTEIFQPICSFIAMTVANNSCVQESFSASEGLETLTLALVRLASAADTSLLFCQLSVIISKTLSACITDNTTLASGLAQYGVVSHLFCLLASPHLDPEDRLSVLLTLGHCTEASEEHQSQLAQCGGLPLVITLLAEDTSEEVKKAATFVLQACKQATMCLGVDDLIAKQVENMEHLTNMEGFRHSARDLLCRTDLLEKRQLKEVEDEQEDIDPPSLSDVQGHASLFRALPVSLQRKEGINTIPTYRLAQAGGDSSIKLETVRNIVENDDNSEMKKTANSLSAWGGKSTTSGGGVWCSACKGTGALMSSHIQSLGSGSELQTANSQFKSPLPVRQTKQQEMKCIEELKESEMSEGGRIIVEEQSVSHIRCAGCVLPFEEVTSRTFATLQSSCQHSCDMHKVLEEATEKFRRRHCSLFLRKEHHDKTMEYIHPDRAEPERCSESWRSKSVSLTPLYRGDKKETSTSFKRTGPALTPLKRQRLPEDRDTISDTERRRWSNSGHDALDDQPKNVADQCSTRRKRMDFSREEVDYLLSGVKKYGFSWNSILWSYPFKPGRTNVGLAKKYRHLMVMRKS